MSLEPIDAETALELYLADKKNELSEASLGQRIRAFISNLALSSKLIGIGLLWLALYCTLLLLATQAKLRKFSKSPSAGRSNKTGDSGTAQSQSGYSTLQNVIIYVRVSTQEQSEEGRSIQSQTSELTSIIESSPELGLFTKPISDEGETGTDFDRNGIERIHKLARNDEVEFLAVDTIDRIGRSVAHTVMLVHHLRYQNDVKLLVKENELDIKKPNDRMQIVMQALMADIGTMTRARSSLRSSVDNFIQDQRWKSWFAKPPFGYTMDGEWLSPVSDLSSVVQAIYDEFERTESYAQTTRKINNAYKHKLSNYADECEAFDGSLDKRQVKSILSRPVYKGEPTLPVTEFDHYEPNPSVSDPELAIINGKQFKRVEEISEAIAKKYSTDKSFVCTPEEYANVFDVFAVESVSPMLQLSCPQCQNPLVANGQEKLNKKHAAREYQCTDCEFSRQWPTESEKDKMEMLAKINEYDSIL